MIVYEQANRLMGRACMGTSKSGPSGLSIWAVCKWSIVIYLAIQYLGPFVLLASSIEVPIDHGVSMAVGGCGSGTSPREVSIWDICWRTMNRVIHLR